MGMEPPMDTLIVLGTGAAGAIHYYNTCFLLDCPEGRLLVDGGGGNGILRQLQAADVPLGSLTDVFVSHEHIDHCLGVVWVIRFTSHLVAAGRRTSPLRIHCSEAMVRRLRTICELTLSPKQLAPIDREILFCPARDGETRTIAGHTATFIDTCSTKAEQYGFILESPDGQRIAFTGDEPCSPLIEPRLAGVDWLLHEAYCLEEQADVFQPRNIGHGTVRDAALLARRCGAKALVLWHTEDKATVGTRKERFSAEASRHFSGGVHVPDDLERIALR